MRDHSQFVGLRGLYGCHICLVFNQMDAAVELAHGAFHLWVTLVANHQKLIAFFGQLGHFHMNFGDQWASGIEYGKAASLSLCLYGFAHPVGRKNQGCAWWYIV